MSYKTGQSILQSGIYQVHHSEHRLPHEVTLLKDKTFPPCSNCKTEVEFQLLRRVNVEWNHIILYQLPVLVGNENLEEDSKQKKVAV